MKKLVKITVVVAFAAIAGYGVYVNQKLTLCLIWHWLMWKH